MIFRFILKGTIFNKPELSCSSDQVVPPMREPIIQRMQENHKAEQQRRNEKSHCPVCPGPGATNE